MFYIACYYFGVQITRMSQNIMTTPQIVTSHKRAVFSCTGCWTEIEPVWQRASESSSLVGPSGLQRWVPADTALRQVTQLMRDGVGPRNRAGNNAWHRLPPGTFLESPCLSGFKLSALEGPAAY